MSDNTAIIAGYTKEIMAYNDQHELHLFVRPDADLDGDFKAYDADECEWIKVSGHLFSIENLTTPFHVVGIDENDGSATVLHEAENSGDARRWMLGYVSKENAGNWKLIQVLDTRSECAETLWTWQADEALN